MSGFKRAGVHLVSLAAAITGANRLLELRRRARNDRRIFILEYHEVCGDRAEAEGVVSIARFRLHLRYLKERLHCLSLRKAMELLDEAGGLREDVAVVTLDDGYASNFEWAWPILREEDVSATVFLTTGFLDGDELWFDFARRALAVASAQPFELPETLRLALEEVYGTWPGPRSLSDEVEVLKRLPEASRDRVLQGLRKARLPLPPAARPLSWDQVRQMQAGGIEFGSHTVSHPILSSLSPERQEDEIRSSSQRIQEETGTAPTSFAIPNGRERDFDAQTLEILRRTGFRAVCTTQRGSNLPSCDRFRLRRIGVGTDSKAVLAARLNGLFDEEVRVWFGV